MDELRVFTAFSIFTISAYLAYDLFATGFSWMVLLFCIGGFVAAHYIWPKNTSGDSHWYDSFEIFIDIPYQSIAFAIRSLARIFKRADIDEGIDL